MAIQRTSRSLLSVFNSFLLLLLVSLMAYQLMLTSSHRKLEEEDPSVSKIRQKRSTDGTVGTVSAGATYIRWGKMNCSGCNCNGAIEAETVYSGVVGGSHFQNTGGGSNYICLPMDPIWPSHTGISIGDYVAKVYGGEYEYRPGELQNHDVPCAVCRTLTRGSVVMIPARNQCYNGWTKEYHGYLVAEYHGHAGRTEFVCMDENPEKANAGNENQNGALFYPAKSQCGSLPCPPYGVNKELSCVVCTK